MKQLWVMVDTNNNWCYEDILIDTDDLTSKVQTCFQGGTWAEATSLNTKGFLKYLQGNRIPTSAYGWSWLLDCKFELAAEWED